MYKLTLLSSVGKKAACVAIPAIILIFIYQSMKPEPRVSKPHLEVQNRTIIAITPTFARPERLAELTRLSQTLMHIPNLIWIVVEDATVVVSAVKRLLDRSGVSYVYFSATSMPGFKKGRIHRNVALEYVRKNYKHYGKNAVVYFADDDNTYDIRLFNDYIRNVETIGVWAVGLVGGSAVDAPHVENGVITSWDVAWKPESNFAIDMAGFAINLDLILNSNVMFLSFEACHERYVESCFLSQFGIDKKDVKPFGWNDDPKELFVWHTKTWYYKFEGGHNNYTFENLKPPTKKSRLMSDPKSWFSSIWSFFLG